MKRQPKALRRFTAKIVIDPAVGMILNKRFSCCWLWDGCCNPDGYGKFRPGTRAEGTMYAHRWSYETFIGPIKTDLTVDHRCHTSNCVNPRHLRLLPKAENSKYTSHTRCYPHKAGSGLLF